MRLVDASDTAISPVEVHPAPSSPEPTGQPDLLTLARDLSEAENVSALQARLEAFLQTHTGADSAYISQTTSTGITPLKQARLVALNRQQAGNAREDELTWSALPMEYRNVRLGTLVIGYRRDREPGAAQRELAELAAFVSAGELSRMTEYRKIEDHIADLNVIRALDRDISRSRDMRAMADIVRDQMGGAVACTLCALLVVDAEGEYLELVSYMNDENPRSLGFQVPVQGSRVGSVYLSGRPVVIGNILEDDGAFSRETANWRSLMIAPLTSGDRTFGALMIGHADADFYDERDLRVVELIASQVANAIYRFLEEKREQDQHLAAIEALSAAVDARDPFTHTHSRRVADLAYLVAREMRLSEHEARQIELAGLLHDIGKIGIPDRILTKPGRLDTEERLIMMSHADMGARIVGRSNALAHLTPIVRHHHEWYDGRGYPDGLRGDEIPISAAILSVVDALETMTSNRVYRRALTVEQARQEIEAGSGSQFHPDVTDAVLRLLDSSRDVVELLAHAPSATPGNGHLAPIRSSDVVALRVLNRIAEEIGALTELDQFLDHVHGILGEELDIEDVHIWLFDEERGAYALAAGVSDLPAPTELRMLHSREADPDNATNDLNVMARGRDGDDTPAQTVICPMFVEDSLVGLIELVLHTAGAVDDREVDLLQAIAAPVASTIRVAQLHDQAKRAARTDGLTGVLNHRAFYQELDRRMSHAAGAEEVHLLIVDVIGLKATNDNFGHIAGDTVLRTVAHELVKRLRAEDIVSRYGGDEFAVILKGPLDLPVDAIVDRLEQPVRCDLGDGRALDVRLRCGHAVTTAGEGRATELVARADALLYRRVRPTERGVA